MNETWVTVFGNVASDPRLISTRGGMMTIFQVAQTPRSERDGVWGDGATSFYEVCCFRRLGEHVAGSVVKGDPVIVTGRLSMRDWQNEERSGRVASIAANHVGHDLLYGTSSFRRPQRNPVPVQAGPGADPEAEPLVEGAGASDELERAGRAPG